MRVLFVSQYFMPEAGATSELVAGITAKLAEQGFDVAALAGQPSYFGARKLPTVMKFDGVEVRRVWSTQLDKNTTIGRVLNSATFALSVLTALVFRNRDALAVALTNPPLLPWICYAAHKVAGLRYVLLIHDVYPDIAIHLGALKEGSWIVRLWRFLNRLAYRGAEHIVVLDSQMKQVIGDELDESERDQKVSVIANWADGKQVVPRARDQHPFFDKEATRSRFVALYSGNIGRFHEIETMLDAATRLDEGGEFLFLFYGAGKQLEAVQRKERSLKNGSVRSLPFQPREMLGTTLTGCDVGFVTLKDGLTGLATPSKLYGVLASGKPLVVIGPRDCEAARIAVEEGCGEVVAPLDGEGLARVLRRLHANPALCERYGLNSRRVFEGSYDLPIISGRWATLLRELDRPAGVK